MKWSIVLLVTLLALTASITKAQDEAPADAEPAVDEVVEEPIVAEDAAVLGEDTLPPAEDEVEVVEETIVPEEAAVAGDAPEEAAVVEEAPADDTAEVVEEPIVAMVAETVGADAGGEDDTAEEVVEDEIVPEEAAIVEEEIVPEVAAIVEEAVIVPEEADIVEAAPVVVAEPEPVVVEETIIVAEEAVVVEAQPPAGDGGDADEDVAEPVIAESTDEDNAGASTLASLLVLATSCAIALFVI